jgi:hypothetical protein
VSVRLLSRFSATREITNSADLIGATQILACQRKDS